MWCRGLHCGCSLNSLGKLPPKILISESHPTPGKTESLGVGPDILKTPHFILMCSRSGEAPDLEAAFLDKTCQSFGIDASLSQLVPYLQTTGSLYNLFKFKSTF